MSIFTKTDLTLTRERYCPLCGNQLMTLPTDCIGMFCTSHRFCAQCEVHFHIEKAGKWHKLSWRKRKENKY